MKDREPVASKAASRVDGDDLWSPLAALRARTTLGPGLTIKELVETGRR